MANEQLRMQFLSGVITEGQYKAKLQEATQKDSLNESMIGGIVGIGAINQIPPREKSDYEMAFEHFLGGKYGLDSLLKEEEEIVKEGKMYFHVLEDGGYGEIGHQGAYDTKEEAQNRANSLSDMFPDSSFYVEASNSEDEPYSVTSSDYDPDNDFNEGKEVEEPSLYEGDNDLFTAKRFYKRTDNPRINILSHMRAINDIVMDMLETDLVKGYGPDERNDIYREYMKFANAVKTLVK